MVTGDRTQIVASVALIIVVCAIGLSAFAFRETISGIIGAKPPVANLQWRGIPTDATTSEIPTIAPDFTAVIYNIQEAKYGDVIVVDIGQDSQVCCRVLRDDERSVVLSGSTEAQGRSPVLVRHMRHDLTLQYGECEVMVGCE